MKLPTLEEVRAIEDVLVLDPATKAFRGRTCPVWHYTGYGCTRNPHLGVPGFEMSGLHVAKGRDDVAAWWFEGSDEIEMNLE